MSKKEPNYENLAIIICKQRGYISALKWLDRLYRNCKIDPGRCKKIGEMILSSPAI